MHTVGMAEGWLSNSSFGLQMEGIRNIPYQQSVSGLTDKAYRFISFGLWLTP